MRMIIVDSVAVCFDSPPLGSKRSPVAILPLKPANLAQSPHLTRLASHRIGRSRCNKRRGARKPTEEAEVEDLLTGFPHMALTGVSDGCDMVSGNQGKGRRWALSVILRLAIVK